MRVRSIVWGVTLAAGAAFIGRAALRTTEGPAVDGELFALVNAGRGPLADGLLGGVTELGSLYAAAAAAAALAITGRRRAATSALAAASGTWLLGQGAKKLVVRPRPHDANPGTRMVIARPKGSSWPSSHPAVLTAFTHVAARELGLGAASRAGLAALDVSVASSRVYLGVHYPSDVASGLLMGRAVARLWPGSRPLDG
jgi:membrane-associated phospholipid phosphatase